MNKTETTLRTVEYQKFNRQKVSVEGTLTLKNDEFQRLYIKINNNTGELSYSMSIRNVEQFKELQNFINDLAKDIY